MSCVCSKVVQTYIHENIHSKHYINQSVPSVRSPLQRARGCCNRARGLWFFMSIVRGESIVCVCRFFLFFICVAIMIIGLLRVRLRDRVQWVRTRHMVAPVARVKHSRARAQIMRGAQRWPNRFFRASMRNEDQHQRYVYIYNICIHISLYELEDLIFERKSIDLGDKWFLVSRILCNIRCILKKHNTLWFKSYIIYYIVLVFYSDDIKCICKTYPRSNRSSCIDCSTKLLSCIIDQPTHLKTKRKNAKVAFLYGVIYR